MPASLLRQLARVLALALFTCWCLTADATPGAERKVHQVQRPSKKAQSLRRAAKVRRARAQAVAPEEVSQLADAIDARAQAVQGNTADARLRTALSTAPLRARLDAFARAASRNGMKVQTFQRRLRGMLTNRPAYRTTAPMKTFFEVTPETLDLFQHYMGENVIWFAASPAPGHLHTLVTDQNGRGNFTHNEYGKGKRDYDYKVGDYAGKPYLELAKVASEQYAVPAQLTAAEMDRFVRYLNAAVATGESGGGESAVYGFKTSSGERVTTACTSWATSAPVGELKRWVRTVDRRVARAATQGALPARFAGGLHPLLAAAGSPAARSALVAEVAVVEALGVHTRSMVRRLGKEFESVASNWPDRPLDLVGRESLSTVMGVSRAQDPAKWMYDLMMSKRVPIVGVLSPRRQTKFSSKTFDLETMGTIVKTGDVVPTRTSLGVIPDDRLPPPQPRGGTR